MIVRSLYLLRYSLRKTPTDSYTLNIPEGQNQGNPTMTRSIHTRTDITSNIYRAQPHQVSTNRIISESGFRRIVLNCVEWGYKIRDMNQDLPHFFCQPERDRSYMPRVASWATVMRVVSHEYGPWFQELRTESTEH